MRVLLLLSLVLAGCDTPFHVLVDGDGRPMRVYEDPYSCQVAAVWHQERGHEVTGGAPECVVMSRARLSQFRLDLHDKERMP